ncbi:hypothetical protein BDR03DRAFT_956366 [Suillus americanus]|nr:hypothetical protein BDR03DRAFT_956366 [Suillus americanus]
MRHYLKFDNRIRVRLIIISLQLNVRDLSLCRLHMAATAYVEMTAFETGIAQERKICEINITQNTCSSIKQV